MSRYLVISLTHKVVPGETCPTRLPENWQKPSFEGEEDNGSFELIDHIPHSLKFLSPTPPEGEAGDSVNLYLYVSLSIRTYAHTNAPTFLPFPFDVWPQNLQRLFTVYMDAWGHFSA